MSDIFDKVAAPPQNGDVFDKLSSGDIFDTVAQPSAQKSIPANVPVMRAAPPMTVMQRIESMFHRPAIYDPNGPPVVAKPEENEESFFAPTRGMTPGEQERHPIAAGIGDVVGGLATPQNLAIAAATAVVPERAAVSKAVALPFAASMEQGGLSEWERARQLQGPERTRGEIRAAADAVLGLGLGIGGLRNRAEQPLLSQGAPVTEPAAPPAEAITPEAIAAAHNLEYRGIQKGIPGKLPDHYTFNDNVTGSSLMSPIEEGEAGVKQRLDAMRQQFAKPTETAPAASTTTINAAPSSFITKVSHPESKINTDIVRDYRNQIKSGQPIEPLKITVDEQGNVLDADGRHRALAAMQEGVQQVPIQVTRLSAAEVAHSAANEALPHDTPLEQKESLTAQAASRIVRNTNAMKDLVHPALLKSANDVPRVLDIMSRELEHNPDPRMTGPVSDAQTRMLADKLGLTPEQLIEAKSHTAFNDAHVVAANTLLSKSVEEVMATARAAQAGDANLDDFLSAMAKHSELNDAVAKKVGAEAGRALRARRTGAPEEDTTGETRAAMLSKQALALLQKLPEQMKRDAAAEFVKMPLDNTLALSKFIRDYTRFAGDSNDWTRFKNAAYEIRINSLLSGGAAFKKLASDAAMVLIKPAMTAFGAAAKQIPGMWNDKFTAATIGGEPTIGEAFAQLHAMIAGAPDALHAMKESWITELGSGSEFEPRSFAIPGRTGRVVRVPSRGIAAVTDFFNSLQTSMELRTLARKQALSEDLRGDQLSNRIANLVANPSVDMLKAAREEARRQTFQEPMKGKFARVLRDAQNLPTGRWLVPFLKTPWNLYKLGLDFTPFGVIRGIMHRDEPALARSIYMRNIAGTTAMAWAYHEALQGKLSGIGPSDPKKRRMLMAAGWQPYSIKVGKHWVSYRYLEPLATPLMMAGNVADSFRYDGVPGEDSQSQLIRAMVEVGKGEFDILPFMNQLSGIISITEGGQSATQRILRAGANELGSLVPVGLTDFARAVDRAYRKPTGLKQEFEARIPGLTKYVPAYTNVLGQPEQRPVNALGGFQPFPVTTAAPKGSPIDELARLALTKQKEQPHISIHSSVVPGGSIHVPVSASELQQIKQMEDAEYGRRANEAIQSLRWQRMSDAAKRKMLTKIRSEVDKQAISFLRQVRHRH